MDNTSYPDQVESGSLRVVRWIGAAVGGICSMGALVLFVVSLWGMPASANVRIANATGKDCAACHVDVDQNAYLFTRYGAAFRRNGCPGAPGGC